MKQRFDYFTVFAEMRTGSNFLEANLNAFPSIACLGEVFNPHFIGYPNSTDVLGITQPERAADPERLLDRIARLEGQLGGFRFFHDHDPRVLDRILRDPRAAKIVLTRNPAESYVSWKIAQATGQWKLTNVRKRKEERARFDEAEFEAHIEALQAFQLRVMSSLQTTGQTAFYVAYEDLQDLAVMNGLARWLGVPEELAALDDKLKRQNPEPLSQKVENFDEMERALVRLDRFNLSRTPNFEPRRGPVVPGYVAPRETGLLYLPIRSGPEETVLDWLAALDGSGRDGLQTGFSQKTLREWMRHHPGHRSFTVIRHPLARAHEAFCRRIVASGPGTFGQIRRHLIKQYDLPLPEKGPAVSLEAHRAAFASFLRFVKANLAGQTPIRTDGHWATQSQVLQGMAEFALPDMIVREEEMMLYLPTLAMQAGHAEPPDPEARPSAQPFALHQMYDAELEQLARDAYQRDYLMFGFSDWS